MHELDRTHRRIRPRTAQSQGNCYVKLKEKDAISRRKRIQSANSRLNGAKYTIRRAQHQHKDAVTKREPRPHTSQSHTIHRNVPACNQIALARQRPHTAHEFGRHPANVPQSKIGRKCLPVLQKACGSVRGRLLVQKQRSISAVTLSTTWHWMYAASDIESQTLSLSKVENSLCANQVLFIAGARIIPIGWRKWNPESNHVQKSHKEIFCFVIKERQARKIHYAFGLPNKEKVLSWLQGLREVLRCTNNFTSFDHILSPVVDISKPKKCPTTDKSIEHCQRLQNVQQVQCLDGVPLAEELRRIGMRVVMVEGSEQFLHDGPETVDEGDCNAIANGNSNMNDDESIDVNKFATAKWSLVQTTPMWDTHVKHKWYCCWREANDVQRVFRGSKGRGLARKLRTKYSAASKLNKFWKTFVIKRSVEAEVNYRRIVRYCQTILYFVTSNAVLHQHGVCKLQACFRGRIAKQEYDNMKASASILNSWFRFHLHKTRLAQKRHEEQLKVVMDEVIEKVVQQIILNEIFKKASETVMEVVTVVIRTRIARFAMSKWIQEGVLLATSSIVQKIQSRIASTCYLHATFWGMKLGSLHHLKERMKQGVSAKKRRVVHKLKLLIHQTSIKAAQSTRDLFTKLNTTHSSYFLYSSSHSTASHGMISSISSTSQLQPSEETQSSLTPMETSTSSSDSSTYDNIFGYLGHRGTQRYTEYSRSKASQVSAVDSSSFKSSVRSFKMDSSQSMQYLTATLSKADFESVSEEHAAALGNFSHQTFVKESYLGSSQQYLLGIDQRSWPTQRSLLGKSHFNVYQDNEIQSSPLSRDASTISLLQRQSMSRSTLIYEPAIDEHETMLLEPEDSIWAQSNTSLVQEPSPIADQVQELSPIADQEQVEFSTSEELLQFSNSLQQVSDESLMEHSLQQAIADELIQKSSHEYLGDTEGSCLVTPAENSFRGGSLDQSSGSTCYSFKWPQVEKQISGPETRAEFLSCHLEKVLALCYAILEGVNSTRALVHEGAVNMIDTKHYKFEKGYLSTSARTLEELILLLKEKRGGDVLEDFNWRQVHESTKNVCDSINGCERFVIYLQSKLDVGSFVDVLDHLRMINHRFSPSPDADVVVPGPTSIEQLLFLCTRLVHETNEGLVVQAGKLDLDNTTEQKLREQLKKEYYDQYGIRIEENSRDFDVLIRNRVRLRRHKGLAGALVKLGENTIGWELTGRIADGGIKKAMNEEFKHLRGKTARGKEKVKEKANWFSKFLKDPLNQRKVNRDHKAILIQKTWRGWKGRQNLRHLAATVIQCAVRRYWARRELRARTLNAVDVYIDDRTGYEYYVNKLTGRSTWTKPYALY